MRSIAIISLAWCTLAYAQADGTTRSRWRIGVSGSSDICHHAWKNGDASEGSRFLYTPAPRNERHDFRLGWTAGLDVSFHLSEHWSIGSGIQFSDRGYRYRYQPGWITVDPVAQDPAIPVELEYRYHYSYVSLPVMVRYTLGKGRVRFDPGFGVWADQLMERSARETRYYREGSSAQQRSELLMGYNAFAISLCIEFGVSINVSDTWDLRFGPRGRYQLTSLRDTHADHLWEAGFMAGISYRL